MNAERLELVTSLSPEDCTARLSAVVNVPPQSYGKRWPTTILATIAGELKADGFSIYLRHYKVLFYTAPRSRSAFELTTAQAAITRHADGTRISGYCGANRKLPRLTWLGIGIFVLVGVPILVLLSRDVLSGNLRHWNDFLKDGIQQKIFGLIWIVAVNGFFCFCRSAGRIQGVNLRRFLVRTLEAREVAQ